MKPEKKKDVKTELKDEELNNVSGGITLDDPILEPIGIKKEDIEPFPLPPEEPVYPRPNNKSKKIG